MSLIEKIVVHYKDGRQEVTIPQESEISKWIEETVHLDSETKERRTILLDHDRGRTFFFSEPLDFDKDDTFKPARYWLDECEGYKNEWKGEIETFFAV